MLYIRLLNLKDDMNRYMECVRDLNSEIGGICNVEQMKRGLARRYGNILTYVITINDEIISTATIIFEKKLRYNKLCAHIEDVGVHKDYRGQGYGKMIVDYVVGVAENKECYKIKLCCSDKNVGFYSKLGFHVSSNGMEKVLTKIS